MPLTKTLAPAPAHTPGPWQINRHYGYPIVSSGTNHIAQICSPHPGKQERFTAREMQEANAHLIAAAPDLLRENRAAVESLRHLTKVLDARTYCDADEFSDELRMIIVNFENATRALEGK